MPKSCSRSMGKSNRLEFERTGLSPSYMSSTISDVVSLGVWCVIMVTCEVKYKVCVCTRVI